MLGPTIDETWLHFGCVDITPRMKVRFRLNDPHIVVIEGVLSNTECQLITEMYSDLAVPAGYHVANGVQTQDQRRTAKAFNIDPCTPISKVLQERLSSLTMWPTAMMEHLNFVRYERDDYIDAHHDFFGPNNRPADGHQRVATALLYLDDAEGSKTVFTELGLTIEPKVGSMVFFAYPGEDVRLRHESPALVGPHKHVLVQWFTDAVIF